MARANQISFSTWAFWCLALTVSLLPIGLGGNRPVPLGMAQAGLALSCIFLALGRKSWTEIRFFTRVRYAFALIGIVILWAFFQAQPLIPSHWAHPVWTEAASVLRTPVHGTIAISPEDSIKGIADLITYVITGLLAFLLAQNPVRARKLVQIIWYTGVAISIYGLIVFLSGINMILWLDKWTYLDDLTATFVNRNHFAIYAGMVFVCGCALLLRSWQHDVQQKKAHQRITAIRDWLFFRAMPQGLLLAIVFTSILLSHSRAGLVLTVLGLGVYLFIYQIYMGAWKRAFLIAFLSLLVLAAAVVTATQFSSRFSQLFTDYSSFDRFRVYKLGWHALQDNPWLGYGLNGFEPEFRLYQQNMIMEFNHAHSDVLESLVDLGVPAGLLLWSAIGLLLSGLWHGVRTRRRDGIFPALALAVSFMALGHAMIDFSLQIPGVVLTWVALLGAGLAQSWSQSEREADSETYKLA